MLKCPLDVTAENAVPVQTQRTAGSPTKSVIPLSANLSAMWNIECTNYHYPTRFPLEEIQPESAALHDDIEDAIKLCYEAQRAYSAMPQARRKLIVQNIRKVCDLFRADFALAAWSETGRGRYEDKYNKQAVAIHSTPGVEDLAPRTYTGDSGLTVIDYAPYGVIGAVTPVTNPTATVINNSITVLSGGNGLVFNPHPGAMRCTNRAIAVVNMAIVQAGGPVSLVSSVKIPTIASGGTMMNHPLVDCNLITGGPAVVKVAMKSGKKSFCAGPGNPPVIVDETANLKTAAKGIYLGASFDNNMICSDEKEVFALSSICDELIEEMVKLGAYHAKDPEEVEQLTKTVFDGNVPPEYTHGQVNKDLVGLGAHVILRKAGVPAAADIDESDCRLIICEVPKGHPLIWTEQLMPVLPIVRCDTWSEALELAKKAEYGYKHTASLYSTNVQRVTEMSRYLNTSIFVVNGSHTAGLGVGGEGYTSFSIAGTTGEGLTRPRTFVRERRLVCVDALNFV